MFILYLLSFLYYEKQISPCIDNLKNLVDISQKEKTFWLWYLYLIEDREGCEVDGTDVTDDAIEFRA